MKTGNYGWGQMKYEYKNGERERGMVLADCPGE